MDNNKFKKIICKNWIEKKCRFMNNSNLCSFAHGKDDIIKNKCLNNIYCWNEKCNYEHPKEWNPYNNKKDCLLCLKGYCTKENKKYNHINDIKEEEVIKKDIFKIPEKEEFPELVKSKEKKTNNYNINMNKLNYVYSEILTYKIKNDLNIKSSEAIDNEMIDIKNKLRKNYIYLKGLNPNDWADSDEIEKTNEEIIILKDKYNKIKNKNEKNDIFYDNLDLDIIFMEDNENKNNNDFDLVPDINFTINGLPCDNIKEITKKDNNEEKNNNIKILIENIKKQINKYIKIIKEHIINEVKDDYIKYILINNLNEIKIKTNIFEENYNDVLNNLIK